MNHAVYMMIMLCVQEPELLNLGFRAAGDFLAGEGAPTNDYDIVHPKHAAAGKYPPTPSFHVLNVYPGCMQGLRLETPRCDHMNGARRGGGWGLQRGSNEFWLFVFGACHWLVTCIVCSTLALMQSWSW